MNFNLSDEQNMLKDSVARFVNDQYDFDARQANVGEEAGFSSLTWATFAELGWLSIPFAEEHGGFGGGPVDTMVVMEELGRGLVAEPYVATVLLFGGLLRRCNDPAVQQANIAGIIDGSVQGAFAYLERQSRFELSDIRTKAVQKDGVWVLDGEKTVVFNGVAADKLIVSVRTSAQQCSDEGISLLLVDAGAAGVEKTSYRMMDGQLVANIRFDGVAAEAVVGEVGAGLALMHSTVDEAKVALAAEALGLMHKLNADTLEYARTREQFGVPIGSFQALQHRMVDMFSACEQTRSLLYRTVCSMVDDSADAGKNICALEVMLGRAGRLIGGEAIQLHGAMGMTEDLPIGHYVKRLMMINSMFGDADFHLQRFADIVGD